MGFLSGLALVLLTLFGYSSGRVLFSGKRKIDPGLFDILFTIFLGVIALWARTYLGKLVSIPVFMLIGSIAGVFLTSIQKHNYPLEAKNSVQHPENNSFLGRLRQSWQAFITKAGNYQSRILLSWFYFVILTPFGILVRVTSDPLAIQKDKRKSYWNPVAQESDSLESARRQF